MARIIMLIMTMMLAVAVHSENYKYRFCSTPLPQAIRNIMDEHPDLDINFIYNELENYTTSADVNADNVYDALRQTVAMNPVTVIKAKNTIYLEALQHGKYLYTGQAVGTDNEPVMSATVMLLAPHDSTVVTFGITDSEGRFRIPCDQQMVIAKLSCVGYKTVFHLCNRYDAGKIIMPAQTVDLATVTVEAENAHLYSDRSIYVPTYRQKRVSQTGTDLLNHMAIPQLGLVSGSNVVTGGGKPVAIFIDYLPANENDLAAMRTADVRRVEYYQHPSDPRLQGHEYVVNFIMAKYEYGGYVKGYDHANLISLWSDQLLGNLRFQYKSMTYDLMGYGFATVSKHDGSVLTETYRLPQPDGSVKEFRRFSNLTSSDYSNQQYLMAFKATFNSDRIQASSQINTSINDTPRSDRSGAVFYSPSDLEESSLYASTLDKCSKYIAYNGYYFFSLRDANSLTFTPAYVYSHTDQVSSYSERGFPEIMNGAVDNTNQLKGELKFKHDFGKTGGLLGYIQGSYEYNRTRYVGSATAHDRAKSSRIEAGATYNISIRNLYGSASFAWDWDRLQFGDMTDCPSTPKASVSSQYSPDIHNSFSLSASYMSWLPSPSFKSDKVIEAHPFMKYTGNPNLVRSENYNIDFSYTWIPNNNFNLSAFAWAWFVAHRYVYDYEATAEGVIRTIKQPMGSFAQGTYGITGSAKFLDRSLVFSGRIGQLLTHNGIPYDYNRAHINWYARARYYLEDWNFTLTYSSGYGSADGDMNGLWEHGKSDWYVTVGWSNADWNVRADMINFSRWNWKNIRQEMNSRYYDTDEQFINGKSRALIQLAVTYTFGFGRKVKRDDEPSISSSASSGILK